jgi:hypothetical protein
LTPILLLNINNDLDNLIVVENITVSSGNDGYFNVGIKHGYKLIYASNTDGYTGSNFGYSNSGLSYGYLYQWNQLKENTSNITLKCIFIKA